MIGKTLAHYQILAKIGQGGMGEVYRALDTKLDREVALKILPVDMARKPERLARFEREARAIAALKHPNIVTIYSVEEADGLHFLTMELVEGKPLSNLIPKDGLPLYSIFDMAIPLVDAVSSAHARGITHRDLKPDNIMIDDEGRLHVLDFGLAKLHDTQERRFSTQATTVAAGTEEGKILGTVAYMSPEQAEGKPVDPRSDIFSLGTILYEMVSGTRPFQGDTNISTIGSILKDEPPSVLELTPSLPRHMSRIIRRCLAKSPNRRYQTAVDLRNELEGFKEEVDSGELLLERAEIGTGRFKGRRFAMGLAVVALVAIGLGYGLYRLLARDADAPDTTATFQQMEMTRLTHTGNSGYSAAISPDGRYVVHVQDDEEGRGLWLLQVNTARKVQIIPPSEAALFDPTFSPDGDLIYYLMKTSDADIYTLYRVPLLGGPSMRVLEDLDGRISFSPDGSQFVFLRTEGTQKHQLVVADLDGGNERVIASRTRPEEYHRDPVWSPDGEIVVVAGTQFGHSEFQLVEVPATGGAERTISSTAWGHIEDLAWLPDASGLVMQAWGITGKSSFQLWDVPYPDGQARRITNDLNSYSGVSLTADGKSLVTQLMESETSLWIATVGEANESEQIPIGSSSVSSRGISWTPDGRIVYSASAGEGVDLWITGKEGGNARQLTAGGTSAYPSVSRDGRYIVFRSTASTENHIWRMDIDGANAVQLTFGDGETRPQCHPDGRTILYLGVTADGNALFKVTMDGGEPVQISERKLDLRPPAISPDGGKVAVRTFDENADEWRTEIIQVEDGTSLRTLDLGNYAFRWSPRGDALDYVEVEGGVGNIWSQPLNGDPPRQLTHFETEWLDDFAWAPDGQAIVMKRRTNSWDVVLLKNFR